MDSCIRVNGVNITFLQIRRKMVNGEPIGEREVVIDVPATNNLPALGMFAINNEFTIEIPTGSGWKQVDTNGLMQYVDNLLVLWNQ